MIKRFKAAFDGCMVLFKKDTNFLIHLLIAVGVLLTSLMFSLSYIEWFFVLTAIFSVIITEAINTAIEYTVDLVTDDYHLLAKHAKDIAAFSVVLASLYALIVGCMIFIPKLF